MSLSQKFLPIEALSSGNSFYSHSGIPLDVTETKLSEYMEGFQSLLTSQGILSSPEELQTIQAAAALIDALSKTRFQTSEWHFPSIEPGHHAFNVFYRAPDSEVWKLQFANAAYLEKFASNLSDKIQASADDLMQDLYLPETIERFTSAAKDWEGKYTAELIEMDRLWSDENHEVPAFFWYRKEFDHPDGGKLQVRIGMNATGLSQEQKTELSDAYRLADILRQERLAEVYYSKFPHMFLIDRIRERLSSLLQDEKEEEQRFVVPLGWIRMILEIAEDIVKNSPFPLTVVDNTGVIEQISPTYSAMVGYRVKDILNPGFFDRIYPGTERKLVDKSIDIYLKNGSYPDDVSFAVSRGNAFTHMAEQHKLRFPKSLELIPFPYPFATGTVRLNSGRPFEAIPGMDDTAPMPSVRFVTDEEEGFWTNSELNAWLQDNG